MLLCTGERGVTLMLLQRLILVLTLSRPCLPADRNALPQPPGIPKNGADTAADPIGAPLDRLVDAYFRCDDVKQRGALAKEIDEAADGTIAIAADAVARVQLWSDLPATGTFTFQSASDGPVSVTYRLPPDYNPTRRHPVLLTLAAAGTPDSPAPRVRYADEFVYLSARWPSAGSFHQPTSAAASDLPRLLREARKLIHTDSNRVYLYGDLETGDEAWSAALTHSDLFAGMVVTFSFPQLPYTQHLYALLLPNLRWVPVTVWGTTLSRPGGRNMDLISSHNQWIIAFAKQNSLRIHGIEDRDDLSSAERSLASTLSIAALEHSRPPAARKISLWFRYPAQGRIGWLRQTKFMGDVWGHDQLHIVTAPTVDRDKFITDVIQDKLAYLGGEVDGQQIRIETRRCAEIELLLPDGLIDFTKPAVIRCNGRKRHDGKIRPSIRILLETAYEEWDFQRLVVARLPLAIKSDSQDG